MAASAPKRLEASIPVWPKGFDPELREVSWDHKESCCNRGGKFS